MSAGTQFIQGEVISSGSGKGQVYYIMKRNDGSEFVAVFPADEDPGLLAGVPSRVPNMVKAGTKNGRQVYKRESGTVTAVNAEAEKAPEPKQISVTSGEALLAAVCTMISYQQGEGGKTPEQNLGLAKVAAAQWKAEGLI